MKFFNKLPVFILVLFISCQNKEPEEKIKDDISVIEKNITDPILVKGEEVKKYSIKDRMRYHKVPGVSIAIVKDGELKAARAYQLDSVERNSEITTKTLFQAGSISKPIAALSVLKLADEGKLDLDKNVNSYLESWKVPDNKYTEEEPVTLRRLLTHTAGMTVHGFPGYQQTDTFPSDEAVLRGEGNTAAIEVDTFPGSFWRYSGGGYTVMERVVEEVTDMPFEVYMDEQILDPLGMSNSTYAQPLPEEFKAQASAAYDIEGKMIEGKWHNYPEQAAAGLWTTPSDLANYIIEIQQSFRGESNKLLSQEIVEEMLTKSKNDWGLGPSLTGAGDSLTFGHGGKNAGFTNNMIAFANRGDGVVVMTNADSGGKLMQEIIMAISEYYDWGIVKPRIIEPASVAIDTLRRYTGKYKFIRSTEEEPYFVEVILEDDQLVVIDTNEGDEKFHLTPLNEKKFVDIASGSEIVFKDDHNLLWNNFYEFKKVNNN